LERPSKFIRRFEQRRDERCRREDEHIRVGCIEPFFQRTQYRFWASIHDLLTNFQSLDWRCW